MPAYTNAKQVIPVLFQVIMDNHRQQKACDLSTMDGWREKNRLRKEMVSLRRDAENMLHWNQDKGNK